MSRTKSSTIRNSPAVSAPSASSSRQLTLGDRVYLKFGRFGTKVIHRLASVAVLALVLFVDYLLVLFTAVNVLPNIAVLIQQGTGVTLDARIDAVIAGWLIPVLFIVAAVLVGEIVVMRRLWRFATGVTRRMGQSLFRLAGEEQQKMPLGKASLKIRESSAA
ncbi:hypothetical protein ACVWY0_001123 [Arthrobacter sp. UYNi723]